MITHSFIVGALLAFSLSAHAGAIAMDGISVEANPVVAEANSGAVLHRDVGLQQGGGNGKDVEEALDSVACTSAQVCENPASVENFTPIESFPRVETFSDLLAVNRTASGAGSLLVLVLILAGSLIFFSRRSPSTK